MRLKEKKLLKKFAATLKKFSAQGAKKVEYGKSRFVANSYPELSQFVEVAFIGKLQHQTLIQDHWR